MAFYNGRNPVNPGASEFDPVSYGFAVAANTKLFESLWIEWTGGSLQVQTQPDRGSGTIQASATLPGDPFVSAVPLPGAAVLLMTALGGAGLVRAWRRRAAA